MAEPPPPRLEAVHEDGVRRMVRGLSRSPRGALVLAIGRSEALRVRVQQLLAEGLGEAVASVALQAGEEAPWQRILDTVGIALAVLPEGPCHELLRKLNVGREARVKARKRVILWVPELAEVDGLREHAPDLWAHRREVVWMLSGADFVVSLPEPEGETVDEEVARLREELAAIDPVKDPGGRRNVVKALLRYARSHLDPDHAQSLLTELEQVDGAAEDREQYLSRRLNVLATLGHIEAACQELASTDDFWHAASRMYHGANLAILRSDLSGALGLVSKIAASPPSDPLPTNLPLLAPSYALGCANGLALPGVARQWQARLRDMLSVPDHSPHARAESLSALARREGNTAMLEGHPLDAMHAAAEALGLAAGAGFRGLALAATVDLATAEARLGFLHLALDTLLQLLTDPAFPTWLIDQKTIPQATTIAAACDGHARLRAALETWLDRDPPRHGTHGVAVAQALATLGMATEASTLLLSLVEAGPGLPATRALELLSDLAAEAGDLDRAEHYALGCLPWVLGWAGTAWKVEAHLRLALIRRRAGRADAAAASLDRARACLDADPVDLQPADSWLAVAREARDQATDGEAAAAPLLSALDRVRSRGLRVHELDLLVDLAELPGADPRRGPWAAAALKLATELSFPMDRARAWLVIGQLALDQGQPDEARVPLDQAGWWISRVGSPDLRERLAGLQARLSP